MNEGKRLIFPGFHAPGNQPEIERQRERKKERQEDPSCDGAKVF